MTLCREFNILDPQRLKKHPDWTPRVRNLWANYYNQTAMHPLALPMGIGVNTWNVRASAHRDNVKGLKPEDFVPYLPKEKTNLKDADAVEKLMKARVRKK